MEQKTEKNEAIEKVGRVFSDYIKNSASMELLWSEKLGYILMLIHRETSEIMESQVLTDAESFCRYMLGEVAQDVLKHMGKDHDAYELTETERTEIRKQLRPYMEQLSEYGYLWMEH